MTADVARDVLTQAEAQARAARVAEPSYEIDLTLGRGDRYRGTASVSFRQTGGADLFLDLRSARVLDATLNGSSLGIRGPVERILLPGDLLRERNVVSVEYENLYDTSGEGFHRFTDPEDGEQYLYSNFEPFAAHRLFPCFDQPDLKATYILSVVAPSHWEVISNSRPVSVGPAGGGDGADRRRHVFEMTPRFSTYLVALVAGPFHVVRDRTADPPMALYSRRSLARQLDTDAAELFEITRQGMGFFADIFRQPYPFGKYDQLFVPEFNPGAMENVAAVTFSERYVFRDEPTETQRLERAEVVLHELAHMWFGDLATMRWWSDLWLNESFATYMSFLCLTEATRFTDAWRAFHTSLKRWAYRQDQLVTTHPIAGDVVDTDASLLNFDGITYGKGAAVLKQLVATIGRDGFAAGMQVYFRRHAWGNADLADFLSALEEGSGRSLREWARVWLETSSLNTLGAAWSTENDRLAELRVHQTALPDHPTLRPHAFHIALLQRTDQGLEIDSLPATIHGPATEVASAVGRPAPLLVFPNHEDHAYAKVELDPVSLAAVRDHLEQVPDGLLRELLWMSLWEMVRDARLSSTEFLAIAREKLRHEPEVDLVESVLDRADAARAAYVPESRREEQAAADFAASRTSFDEALSGSRTDAALTWARALVGSAATRKDVEAQCSLLDRARPESPLASDQDLRWSIAIKAVAWDVAGAEEVLQHERRMDPSDRGDRMMLRAEAARPSAVDKERVWDRIHGEGYGSFHLTGAAMLGFWWPHQRSVLEPYRLRFFDEVRGVFRRSDRAFSRAYVLRMYPGLWGEPEILDRTHDLIGGLSDREASLKRLLQEAADDLTRAIACRRIAER